MRFLIDECLSLDPIETAAQAGYEAQHVARLGKAGWKDRNVAAHASVGDFVLVTGAVLLRCPSRGQVAHARRGWRMGVSVAPLYRYLGWRDGLKASPRFLLWQRVSL